VATKNSKCAEESGVLEFAGRNSAGMVILVRSIVSTLVCRFRSRAFVSISIGRTARCSYRCLSLLSTSIRCLFSLHDSSLVKTQFFGSDNLNSGILVRTTTSFGGNLYGLGREEMDALNRQATLV
jgi:hypothetical protein